VTPTGRASLRSLRRAVAIGLAALAGASPGLAQPQPRAGDPTAPPAGKVDLDQLLQLPDSLDYGVERRGGATRSEWRSRFHEARKGLEEARSSLADAQEALAKRAGSSDGWAMAPPGLPAEAAGNDANTVRLREEVRRQRAEVSRAETRLRDLDVEANLAGIPADWREARPEANSGDRSVTPAAPPR
jgi:hypothetical protein